MILDAIPDPSKHVAHFHMTRGWGTANVLAALLAGVTHFESTLGGTGGQPANFVDRTPVAGTGEYYYEDPTITGLVSTEDTLVMMDEMGIDTGVDIDKVLEIGRMVEKIIGMATTVRVCPFRTDSQGVDRSGALTRGASFFKPKLFASGCLWQRRGCLENVAKDEE